MKKTTLIVAMLIFLMLAGALPGQDSGTFKVIVNTSNPITSLSTAEVSELFLKKTDEWSDGSRVVPIDQVEDSAVRESFTRSVHARSISAVEAYWQQMVFSGRKVPPQKKRSDREVVDYVASNPGAIGYVSPGASVGDCKTVSISN